MFLLELNRALPENFIQSVIQTASSEINENLTIAFLSFSDFILRYIKLFFINTLKELHDGIFIFYIDRENMIMISFDTSINKYYVISGIWYDKIVIVI